MEQNSILWFLKTYSLCSEIWSFENTYLLLPSQHFYVLNIFEIAWKISKLLENVALLTKSFVLLMQTVRVRNSLHSSICCSSIWSPRWFEKYFKKIVYLVWIYNKIHLQYIIFYLIFTHSRIQSQALSDTKAQFDINQHSTLSWRTLIFYSLFYKKKVINVGKINLLVTKISFSNEILINSES